MTAPSGRLLEHPADALLDTARALAGYLVAAMPWWGWVALAVLVLDRVRAVAHPWRRRDPVRWFDSYQCSHGRARAGGRCEYAHRLLVWRRCPAPAQEADHFFPWSRGGATSLENLVAACGRHNHAKGGRAPSALTRWAIAARRRAYFPVTELRAPGAWYRRRQR